MKKIFSYIAAVLTVGALLPMGMTSCTDMGGDGVDSVLWNGSSNPQNTSFHNPVWEPSLEAGTMLKGSSMYVALSATTQWAAGLTYYCPALTSTNVTDWSRASSDAFTETTLPTWSSARINSLSADFARTIANANYWLFYTTEENNGIGAAQSASSPQGPYTDQGQITLKTTTSVVKNPFFIVAGTSFYLAYTTENGTYLQKMTVKRNQTPTCSGDPTLIADTSWDDVCIYRAAADDLYLFGTVNGEIHYARAGAIAGPYNDKSGTSIASGSKGETLITANSTYATVENPMRAFANAEVTHLFLAYNATESAKTTMASGYARKPFIIQPLALGEDGWFTQTYTPEKGWTAPKYQ